MNLANAPFHRKLRITTVATECADTRLVLRQMGIAVGEIVEKLHVAPLGDPVTFRIGGQRFSLRGETCAEIAVVEASA